MAKLLTAKTADDFRFWTNIQLMKALGRTFLLVTVMLLTSKSTIAAESPVVAGKIRRRLWIHRRSGSGY